MLLLAAIAWVREDRHHGSSHLFRRWPVRFQIDPDLAIGDAIGNLQVWLSSSQIPFTLLLSFYIRLFSKHFVIVVSSQRLDSVQITTFRFVLLKPHEKAV